jgi:mono/diheme cytochrome c family protein
MTRLFFVPFLLSLTSAIAQNDSNAGNDSSDKAVAKPVMKWSFEDSKEPGPRAPTYPGFAKENTAIRFIGEGKKALKIADSEELRFGLNETITLEAWVKTPGLSGTPYIIGKGRLGTKEFGQNNQNYALRLQSGKAGAQIGFLFHSADVPGKKGDWHRWWSKDTMPIQGWHHIAVTYTFGQPKSIKGFIDGQPTDGTWDMGGATDRGPVTDGDSLLIGSGSTLASSHSLNGWLDGVAIYRGAIDTDALKAKYRFVPPPPPIAKKEVPAGRVLVQLAEEGMPEANAWPSEPPKVGETYTEDVFGFFDVPQKYVETGVRGERHVPFLLRAAASVTFPKGKHRLLLRARGATNLYIDGKTTLNTPFPPNDSDGHHLVADQKDYLDLGPAFRFVPPGNRESWCEFEGTGKPQFFVLETVVGSFAGKAVRRPELGETVVAWSKQGTETWQLVTAGKREVAYNDAGWTEYEKERNAHYDAVNAKKRAELRAKSDPYWTQRREAAKAWLAKAEPVKVPELPKNFPASNEIDHFIAARIDGVKAQDSHKGSIDYFKDVMPILEAKCNECHRGAKAKGGLHLDSLADALKGGKSDGAAIAPGKPDHSSIIARITSDDEDEVMPPKGKPLTKDEIALLSTWIKEGAHWPDIRADHLTLTPLTDDLTFLRRVTIDTIGVVPTLEEITAFQKNPDRKAAIDRLLNDPRWADNWMGYWQDVLAENPNILNPTLNNTGPFRWWLYESLKDNKSMDFFVTELLRMKGSERLGGPAGFGTASQNDVPMAAKGTIVSTAFLGVEMKCARCHDSPTGKSLQQDLFELAAMLGSKEIEVPKTSSVPMDKIHAGGRKPLIQVTLMPGTKVQPKWPFAEFCDEATGKLAEDPKDTRDVLAAMITAPQNERFAQVTANRIWSRFMGRGIVEPVEDWEKGKPTHPELIKWLGREFVRGGYDVKNLARLILNSHAYQRATDPELKLTSPLYTSPAPRRLQAEQIVDSLFAATGKPFRTEEVCLDIDNTRDLKNAIHMGKPHRSWMLTSTSNERDRPSLALPRIQAVTDVLSAFGWRGARQDPISKRDADPNVLQPAILSNGTLGIWLSRLSDDHGITGIALKAKTVDEVIDTLFLKLLTRKPTTQERELYTQHLSTGFETRISNLKSPISSSQSTRSREKYVSWSNHLDAEATTVRMAQEAAARQGEPPTEKLDAAWRTRMEDVLWAILNAPEWAFSP